MPLPPNANVSSNNFTTLYTSANNVTATQVTPENLGNMSSQNFTTLYSRGSTSVDPTITVGTQGLQGLQGLQGPQGIQGILGIQGSQGLQGTQGLDGSFAAQGVQGPQGLQGIQGLQGLQGIAGNANVGGSNTEVQYNNNGVFGGEPTFTFNNVSNVVTIANVLQVGNTTGNLTIGYGNARHREIVFVESNGNVNTSNTTIQSNISSLTLDARAYGPGGQSFINNVTGQSVSNDVDNPGAASAPTVATVRNVSTVWNGNTYVPYFTETRQAQLIGLDANFNLANAATIPGAITWSTGYDNGNVASNAQLLNSSLSFFSSGSTYTFRSPSSSQINIQHFSNSNLSTNFIFSRFRYNTANGASEPVQPGDTIGNIVFRVATSPTGGGLRSAAQIIANVTSSATISSGVTPNTDLEIMTTVGNINLTTRNGTNSVVSGNVYIGRNSGTGNLIANTLYGNKAFLLDLAQANTPNVVFYNDSTGELTYDTLSGLQGLQGIQGVTGSQGIQGLQGIGSPGTQGLQGLQGLQGVSVQGIQGLQGPTAAQGLQGLQGVSGIQGTGSNPGGSNTQVQYNNNGVFGGSASFTFNNTSNTVTVENLRLTSNNVVLGNSSNPTNGGVSIGYFAAANSTGLRAIAIGSTAGTLIGNSNSLLGNDAIAIGYQSIATSNNSISIGQTAGANIGNSAIVIGSNAALGTGNAQTSVIIGESAGQYTGNILDTVIIGGVTGGGAASTIGNSVMIGRFQQVQGNVANGIILGRVANIINSSSAIAIGHAATANGNYTIAFGANSNINANNTIVINATGSNLYGNTANATFIKPVRQANTANAMFYNTTTGEITYDLLSGLQGIQGLQGITGSQGTTGSTGLQGTQGTTGSNGAQGLQGITGSQGLQGLTGGTGIQGTQGLQGLIGSNGAQGTTGLQGLQGLQGIQGIQSLQGLQGPTGLQGLQGISGPVGGANTEVQYNDNGVLNGSNTFTFNNTSNTVTITNLVLTSNNVTLGNLSNSNTYGISIGYNSANAGQGANSIAIGVSAAGTSIQGNNTIAIGTQVADAGVLNDFSIGIGYQAFINGSGNKSIAIGYATSGVGASGDNSILLGSEAGPVGNNTIAIGANVLQALGIGVENAVVIGDNAGLAAGGNNIVVIGKSAAENALGNNIVAVGNGAGQNGMGNNSIAIGNLSGYTILDEVIAIGSNTGANGLGNYSIAIGYEAGSNTQVNNTIILNASGVALDHTQANSFFVKPIRNANTANVLYYDDTTGEILYDLPTGGGGTPGGNTTEVQFNSSGSFAGSANFTFDSGNSQLTVTNISSNSSVSTKFTEGVYNFGNASGTLTIDVNNGSIQRMTANGNITINSISNVANGTSMTLVIAQDATGNRQLSSTMKFAGNLRTLSTAANAIDVMCIFYDGTNYLASLTKGYA